MDEKNVLKSMIEIFYVDVIEEFKEIEPQLIVDSKYKALFKKRDFESNLDKIKECKQNALKIDTEKLKANASAKEIEEFIKPFEKCLVMFNALCDCYIRLQTSLKGKDKGERFTMSEYRELFEKLQTSRNMINTALHDLDIIYTDKLCTEYDDPYTFV